MAFFLQGAPGDMNPYLDKTPLLEDAENEMARTGELGHAVVNVACAIVTQPKPNARLVNNRRNHNESWIADFGF